MVNLIARLRGLIYDPESASQIFDDDDLQGFLDDHRTDARYLELEPHETYASGGAVSYLTYTAPVGDWESTVSIVDSNYDAVTADTSDYRRGVWTFATSKTPPLYLSGSYYNIHSAAVAALREWLARLKLAYDFTADGATFKRSQQVKQIEDLIARYEGAAGAQVMTMTRSDVIC